MFAAFFQADGEMRHTIAVTKFRHTAEFEMEMFVARMTHPEVGVWFVWIDEVTEEEANDLQS